MLEAYPNPANGELTLDLPHGAYSQIIPISLFDGLGKMVIKDQFNSGEATKNLITNDLPSGIYFLRVDAPKGKLTKKVIVVH